MLRAIGNTLMETSLLRIELGPGTANIAALSHHQCPHSQCDGHIGVRSGRGGDWRVVTAFAPSPHSTAGCGDNSTAIPVSGASAVDGR